MRRMTLMLDRRLLAEVVRLTNSRTFSEAVARALEDLVRRVKARGIVALAGTALWEDNLADMRRDRPRGRRRGRRRR